MNADKYARVPHTELRLSGDFGGPFEVLSSEELTQEQKLQILNVWKRDLTNADRSKENAKLMSDVEKSIAKLTGEAEGGSGDAVRGPPKR